MRSLVYAFDRSFEGAIAASTAPIVGVLAEKLFGFEGTATLEEGEDGAELNLVKAEALGNALLLCVFMPWAICLVVYTGLHWSYPRDKARAALQAEMRSSATGEKLPLSPPLSPRPSDLDVDLEMQPRPV
jgi:hypothetical protein